jgi:hypothetical protein
MDRNQGSGKTIPSLAIIDTKSPLHRIAVSRTGKTGPYFERLLVGQDSIRELAAVYVLKYMNTNSTADLVEMNGYGCW